MAASKSKINKSDSDRDYREGLKTPLNILIKDFLNAAYAGNNPEKELRLAHKIGEFDGAYAKLQSARAIAGVAFRHCEHFGSQTSMLFSNAFENASRASWLNIDGMTRYRAEKFKLNLPLLSIISGSSLPDQNQIKSNLDARTALIPGLLDRWEKIQTTGNIQSKIDAVGYMSEEAVGLLLSRWVILNSVDNFVPVDSLFSQDSGRLSHSEVRTGWDVSIYTDYPTTPTLAHRLQVKTNVRQEQIYVDSEDFSIVSVSNLRIPKERTEFANPQKILQEIHDNSSSNDISAKQAGVYLDYRTEVLLDIFS